MPEIMEKEVQTPVETPTVSPEPEVKKISLGQKWKGMNRKKRRRMIRWIVFLLIVAAAAAVEEDEDEVIAVIAAAVAAVAAAEGTRLAVKSFRRVGAQAPAWNRAGRQDIIANRF